MNNLFNNSFRNVFITIIQFSLGILFVLGGGTNADAQDLDVPYVPTPPTVVEKMLDLADVQSSDYVIDLGSGDGRIVIAAAKRGASGHGIDLDPERIAEARENASNEGVDDQIMFMEANLFNTDFSKASVITMYLLPSVNKKLRPELLSKLEPGTQIVSHSFDMGDWKADKQVTVGSNNGTGNHDVFYWVIPAKANGTWKWDSGNTQFSMDISQKYQDISVDISDNNGAEYQVQKAELQGKRMTIRAKNGNQTYIFSGRIEGDSISGMMQHHNGDDKVFSTWTASR